MESVFSLLGIHVLKTTRWPCFPDCPSWPHGPLLSRWLSLHTLPDGGSLSPQSRGTYPYLAVMGPPRVTCSKASLPSTRSWALGEQDPEAH